MGDENPIRTLGDYSRPNHEGYRNTIKLPDGNNVVPLRSDTIRLVQNECSFHGLRSEDPNQHLKDFLKLMDSLDLDVANRERTRLRLFQFPIRDKASNWLEHLLARSISTWEDLTTRFLTQFFLSGRTAKLPNDILIYNDPRDFAKPFKAISLPQDVPCTSDRRLIELKNQVQRLMEAHLAPKSHVQVNKINSLCEICSGPYDTQYCMENPKQTFVDYVSLRNNEVGGRSGKEDLTTRLLAQFFPPGRTAKLQNDILMFQQHQVQIFYDHVNPATRRTINQSAGGKLHDKNVKEFWALIEDLALYDNESWNDPRDFAKPVKAISLPQDVPSTSDRRLIELENQVQRLMEAPLDTNPPVQVNKIAFSFRVRVHSRRIGDFKPFDTLADLGSCVNLIPLYLFKKLKIGLLEEIDHVFGLADGTKSYPIWKAKIAVGEGVTRSIFGVKEINLGDEDVPYWTTLGKRESYEPRPRKWEIARDAELKPFKDVLVFRKMVEFLGAIPINLKGNMWELEELIEKRID
ncbi:MAK10-like protein [Tanacetum coccineum]